MLTAGIFLKYTNSVPGLWVKKKKSPSFLPVDGERELYLWEITIEDINNLKLPSSTNDHRARECPAYLTLANQSESTVYNKIKHSMASTKGSGKNNNFEAEVFIFAIGWDRFRMKFCIPVFK